MDVPLSNFIQQRRSYLLSERERLAPQLAAVNAELAQLEAAQRSAEAAPRPRRNARDPGRQTGVPRGGPGQGTIMWQARETLRRAGCWMSADQVRQQILDIWGREVARETLSPQLSRLSRDGWIVRDDGLYRYREQLAERPDQ